MAKAGPSIQRVNGKKPNKMTQPRSAGLSPLHRPHLPAASDNLDAHGQARVPDRGFSTRSRLPASDVSEGQPGYRTHAAGSSSGGPCSPRPPVKRAQARAPLAPLTTVLIAVTLLGLPLFGQLSRKIRAKDVKFPEFYESPGGQKVADLPPSARSQLRTNRLKSILMGKEGQYLSNEIFLINEMQLEHYQPDGRTSLVAQAPQCLFDSDSRVAWSTGRLDLTGLEGAVLVHGRAGFQVRMTNSTMSISNRVRTIIRQDLLRPAKP